MCLHCRRSIVDFHADLLPQAGGGDEEVVAGFGAAGGADILYLVPGQELVVLRRIGGFGGDGAVYGGAAGGIENLVCGRGAGCAVAGGEEGNGKAQLRYCGAAQAELGDGFRHGVAEADDFGGGKALPVFGQFARAAPAPLRDGEGQRRQKADAQEDIEKDIAVFAAFHTGHCT